MTRHRENRIDLIRGVSLLLIFVGHSNFLFSEAVQNARGFADASELFVLMAGISAALAYSRVDRAIPLMGMMRAPLLRAAKLYRVHILLLAATVLLLALPMVAALPDYELILKVLKIDGFRADPARHALEMVSLSYMPGNFDILPMYVILIASVPFLLWLHDRSVAMLLSVSVAVWLAAGFGHINFINTALPSGHWYFDPLSWQLIFIIGLVIGLRIKRGQPALPYSRPVFWAALAVALAAVPLNWIFHYHLAEPPSPWLYSALTSKTNDGILRLGNALAVVYVLWHLDSFRRAADGRWLRPLCVAGKHSLPVFVTGIVLSNIVLVAMAIHPQLPLINQMLVLICGCLIQVLLAAVLERRRLRTRSTSVAASAAVEIG